MLKHDPLEEGWQYCTPTRGANTQGDQAEIHYAYRRALRGMMAMTHEDIRHTAIGALWDIRTHQPHTEEAMTELQTFARAAVKRRVKGSDIRDHTQEFAGRLR